MHALTQSPDLDIGCSQVLDRKGNIIAYCPRVDDVTFVDRFETAAEAIDAAYKISDYDAE